MLKVMTLRNDWRGRGTCFRRPVPSLRCPPPRRWHQAVARTSTGRRPGCQLEAGDDLRVGSAICLNLSEGRASGFELEVNPETGERLELVDYGPR